MTARCGVLIGGVLAALVLTLALIVGGADDGSGGGGEPDPAATEAPADLLACLEEQGVDVSGGIPHSPQLHERLEACGKYLPRCRQMAARTLSRSAAPTTKRVLVAR